MASFARNAAASVGRKSVGRLEVAPCPPMSYFTVGENAAPATSIWGEERQAGGVGDSSDGVERGCDRRAAHRLLDRAEAGETHAVRGVRGRRGDHRRKRHDSEKLLHFTLRGRAPRSGTRAAD